MTQRGGDSRVILRIQPIDGERPVGDRKVAQVSILGLGLFDQQRRTVLRSSIGRKERPVLDKGLDLIHPADVGQDFEPCAFSLRLQ